MENREIFKIASEAYDFINSQLEDKRYVSCVVKQLNTIDQIDIFKQSEEAFDLAPLDS
jgi:hypothetical protein